jgi:hypothetical protein
VLENPHPECVVFEVRTPVCSIHVIVDQQIDAGKFDPIRANPKGEPCPFVRLSPSHAGSGGNNQDKTTSGSFKMEMLGGALDFSDWSSES